MQSNLYFASRNRAAAAELLRRLHAQPALTALQSICPVECISIESAYPAEALIPLLSPLGEELLTKFPLPEDARVLLYAIREDADTVMLLRAAGVEASAERQTYLLLSGLDDAAFRAARDTLALFERPARQKARSLADDAFVGFTELPQQLEEKLHALGLALPSACISAIADHFRKLGRDPFPDEILVLNEALRAAETDPEACAPTTFTTDDPRLHAAYADLMEKRRLLAPDASAPATLAELSTLASRYLAAQSRISPSASYCAVGRPENVAHALAAYGGKAIGGFADAADEAAILLSDTPFPNRPLTPNDRLVLVTPGKSHSEERFTQAISSLFSSSTASQIRRAMPVRSGELIGALGKMLGDTGLGLALSSPPVGLTMTEFLSPCTNGVLLACASTGGTQIPSQLRSLGLQFALLAEVQNKAVISAKNAPERFYIPSAMLAPRPILSAEISSPTTRTEQSTVDPIPAMLASLASPANRDSLGTDPLSASIACYPSTSVRCGDKRLCAASVEPEADPFGEVRDCILSLITRMAARGIPYTGITLSVRAELPLGDALANGRAIAALLALHTVQVELGLPAERPVLQKAETLRVTVGVYAPEQPSVLTAPRPNTPLWLIVPRSTVPHLNGETALLQLLSRAVKPDAAAPIPVGMLTPAAAAARETVRHAMTLNLTAPPEVLSGYFPGGILLSAPTLPPLPQDTAAIALGTLLPWDGRAVVYGEQDVSADRLLAAVRGDLPAPLPLSPALPSLPLISRGRHSRPRVLLPFTDTEPTALVQTLTALGAEPVLFPIRFSSVETARKSISDLAGALSSAQILLLTGSRIFTEALLTQRRAIDAIREFRAREGLVCATGEAFAAMLARGEFSSDASPISASPRKGERLLCSVFTASVSPWSTEIPIGSRETFLLPTDPICPDLSHEAIRRMTEEGRLIACAEGTPDGTTAITALTSPDKTLLGLAPPPSRTILSRIIAYFA